MTDTKHQFGICVYGILYATGKIGGTSAMANPHPLDADGFLDLAIRNRLSVVELPVSFISAKDEVVELRRFRRKAENAGVQIVVAGSMILDVDRIGKEIELCSELGAKVLRCTMSKILCGDRTSVGRYADWKQYVSKVVDAVRENLPAAQRSGIRIAIENHQDADAETLAEICETFDSPNVGVTLDAGNPLAVGQDPLEFAERLLVYIADVHLKDYRMIRTSEGFRLVHCAIGDGVVDFRGLWNLLSDHPEVPRSLEMAAWNERHIRLLAPEWWAGYGTRDVRTIIPVFRLLQERGEPDTGGAEWRTPLELGDMSNAEAWEMERLARSIQNLALVEGE